MDYSKFFSPFQHFLAQLTASWKFFQSNLPPGPLLGTLGLAGRELGPSEDGTSEITTGSALDDKSSSTDRALDTSLLLAEIKCCEPYNLI